LSWKPPWKTSDGLKVSRLFVAESRRSAARARGLLLGVRPSSALAAARTRRR
jgi:hypothetical protein